MKVLRRGWKGKERLHQGSDISDRRIRMSAGRGGRLSGRGNCVSHESRLESAEHVCKQVVKSPSVLGRITPLIHSAR